MKSDGLLNKHMIQDLEEIKKVMQIFFFKWDLICVVELYHKRTLLVSLLESFSESHCECSFK